MRGRRATSAARLAVAAVGELHRCPAVGVHAPDVADALVGLPVGLGQRVEDLLAVGRELRVARAAAR